MATFENLHQYPRGLNVIVNGTIVVEEGKHVGAKPGELLRGI